MILFLPRAGHPCMAAWEAMWHVGYGKIGMTVIATFVVPLFLFDFYGVRWVLEASIYGVAGHLSTILGT